MRSDSSAGFHSEFERRRRPTAAGAFPRSTTASKFPSGSFSPGSKDQTQPTYGAHVRTIIKNRKEFDDCLAKAIPTIKQLVVDAGHDPVLAVVLRQLEAIQQWTANGQDVTPEQDQRIYMGLQASRQMADFPDERDIVIALDSYIKSVMAPQ